MGRQIPVVINPRMFMNVFFFVNQEPGFTVGTVKEERFLNNYIILEELEGK